MADGGFAGGLAQGITQGKQMHQQKQEMDQRKAYQDAQIKAFKAQNDLHEHELAKEQESQKQLAGYMEALPPDKKETIQEIIFGLRKPMQDSKPMVVNKQLVSQTGELLFPKPGSPEAKTSVSEDTFKQEGDIRKEFIKGSQEFSKIVSRMDTIEGIISGKESMNSEKQTVIAGTPAADVAMIFAFMKMLDPESVVREGEQATAANARGVEDRVRSLYNRLIKGDKLAPEQRLDFVSQARKIYQKRLQTQKSAEQFYTGLSGQYGLDPQRVVRKYRVQPLVDKVIDDIVGENPEFGRFTPEGSQ